MRRKFTQMENNIISYGSCQFPTLGFVVERWRAIDEFQSETFWKIEVNHTKQNQQVQFLWERNRIFSQQIAQAFFIIVQDTRTGNRMFPLSRDIQLM